MKTEKSEYELQAETFMEQTNTTMQAVKLGFFPYWGDDKDSRDVYQITLTRTKPNGRTEVYSFRFGQSIAKSGGAALEQRKNEYCRAYARAKKCSECDAQHSIGYKQVLQSVKAPTAYNVLACLTKYDPGTFANFCAEYGYDTDSRKAEKTYFAVQDEFQNVQRLFGDSIDALSEIA